jgi:hypothetical protein
MVKIKIAKSIETSCGANVLFIKMVSKGGFTDVLKHAYGREWVKKKSIYSMYMKKAVKAGQEKVIKGNNPSGQGLHVCIDCLFDLYLFLYLDLLDTPSVKQIH